MVLRERTEVYKSEEYGRVKARGRVLFLSCIAYVVALFCAGGAGASITHSQRANADRLWLSWKGVARCESGLQWRYNGRSGYDGAFQFHPSTWSNAVQGTTYARYQYAYQAPPIIQVLIAERWRKRIGGNPHSTAGWPKCGRFWRLHGTTTNRSRH